MAASDFWDDVKQAQTTIQKANDQKEQIDTYESLKHNADSLAELAMVTDDQSEDFILIVDEVLQLEKLKIKTPFKWPYDDFRPHCYTQAGGTSHRTGVKCCLGCINATPPERTLKSIS